MEPEQDLGVVFCKCQQIPVYASLARSGGFAAPEASRYRRTCVQMETILWPPLSNGSKPCWFTIRTTHILENSTRWQTARCPINPRAQTPTHSLARRPLPSLGKAAFD